MYIYYFIVRSMYFDLLCVYIIIEYKICTQMCVRMFVGGLCKINCSQIIGGHRTAITFITR